MKFKKLILIFLLLTFPLVVFANAAVQVLSYEEFFAFVFNNIGEFKGATSLGVTFLIVQILVKLFETKVGALIGKWKLTIVAFLTLIVGTLGMSISTNVSIVTAIFSSANLVLLQAFGHQVYKQFFIKED